MAEEEPGSFGMLLREHRRAGGFSQQELAERAGLSRRGVSDLERGARRKPYPATVRRLAEALGLVDTQRAAFLVAANGQSSVQRQPARTHGAPSPESASHQPAQRRVALPRPLASFVGREHELAELRHLLGATRLLTLTGTGGVGKTRLALALAHELAAVAEQTVAFVDLGPLTDAQFVDQTVAAALGVREQPDRPILSTLADALQGRELVLILDNCEHLIQACAQLSHTLLSACPDLRILATSREALGLAGEVAWRVPSLALPELAARPEHIGETAAVRLFVARASNALPGFALNERNARAVAAVCRRLDGIPLALELAAARAPLLAAEQIAARLDDALGLLVRGSRQAPARQQTLRATLDWSYELLAAPEQLLFDRLAVFAGDWSIEAAEAVAGTNGLAPRHVLALLGQLVDKSLVVVEAVADSPVRYRLQEALRQYGSERLAARAETEAARDRHADFFLALAERTEPALHGHGGQIALAILESEHDNCRAALRWLIACEDAERAQRLAGALGRFWFFRGYLTEGEAWTAQALALPGGTRPTAGRAKTLHGACAVALSRGDYAAVERFAVEARDLWHQLGDRGEEGFAYFVLGQAAERQGAVEVARAHYEVGLALTRAAGHGAGEANNLFGLAELAYGQGDDRAAREWGLAALARANEAGWAVGISIARRVLGAISLRQGDYPEAAHYLEASLADARAQGARWWIAETLAPFGQLALEQGDSGLAHARLTESMTLAQELADLGTMARALEGLMQLAVVWGAPERALHLAGAAAALREAVNAPLVPGEHARLERHLAAARRTLGDRAARAAWEAGRILPLPRVVDLALTNAPAAATTPTGTSNRDTLTTRERAVARLVAQGLTNRQIAERLFIAEGTAERHIGNILAKLAMRTRSQIAAWAVGQHLLRDDSGS